MNKKAKNRQAVNDIAMPERGSLPLTMGDFPFSAPPWQRTFFKMKFRSDLPGLFTELLMLNPPEYVPEANLATDKVY
jgi:hypothetical protein